MADAAGSTAPAQLAHAAMFDDVTLTETHAFCEAPNWSRESRCAFGPTDLIMVLDGCSTDVEFAQVKQAAIRFRRRMYAGLILLPYLTFIVSCLYFPLLYLTVPSLSFLSSFLFFLVNATGCMAGCPGLIDSIQYARRG